eukprot:103738-Chlamydomonas_euryale.AAC.3
MALGVGESVDVTLTASGHGRVCGRNSWSSPPPVSCTAKPPSAHPRSHLLTCISRSCCHSCPARPVTQDSTHPAWCRLPLLPNASPYRRAGSLPGRPRTPSGVASVPLSSGAAAPSPSFAAQRRTADSAPPAFSSMANSGTDLPAASRLPRCDCVRAAKPPPPSPLCTGTFMHMCARVHASRVKKRGEAAELPPPPPLCTGTFMHTCACACVFWSGKEGGEAAEPPALSALRMGTFMRMCVQACGGGFVS